MSQKDIDTKTLGTKTYETIMRQKHGYKKIKTLLTQKNINKNKI